MKLFKFRIIFYFVLISLSSLASAGGFRFKGENIKVQDTVSFVSPFEEDNQRCFKCHGQAKYEYTNETLGRQVKALMCSERIVHKEEFYKSNHKSFSCTDCHSEEYIKFPHSGELRMEQKYNCIDCHGGDEKFAKYHFEEIETEYKQSTHISSLKKMDSHAGNVIIRTVTRSMSETMRILKRQLLMITPSVLIVTPTSTAFSF